MLVWDSSWDLPSVFLSKRWQHKSAIFHDCVFRWWESKKLSALQQTVWDTISKPANNSQSSVKWPTNFGFWRAKAWPGLSLSLPFFLFLTYQTGVLTRKTWFLSGHMTTLLPKVICGLASGLQALNIVIPSYIYIVSWFTKSARDLTRWSWIESLLDSYEK